MKFSTFVKLGGHAFSLMQNKDLQELYGLAKPALPKLLQTAKQPLTSKSSPAPVTHWPAGLFPTHFPAPIDSHLLHGQFHPYGMVHRPGWIYGVPAVAPRSRNSLRTVSHRKKTHRT